VAWVLTILSSLKDSEGCGERKVWWYQKFKRRSAGLDSPERWTLTSASLPKCQDDSRLPSPCNRSTPLPRRCRLGGWMASSMYILLSFDVTYQVKLVWRWSLSVARWLSMAINGQCLSMRKNMIPKTLGMASSEASFLFGWAVSISSQLIHRLILSGQAFKHIFTSPSLVEKEVKATRSGNARLHGMTHVTMASLAYIATQVHFTATFHH